MKSDIARLDPLISKLNIVFGRVGVDFQDSI